ncbi:MAG: tetratricopeptide repeat protein [Pseudomonadota bacterium]|nr:tetratricopeptide repeat protein [Pseudomonadota bacterium]
MPELEGICLFVLGRLHGLTRLRLRELLQRAGGRIVGRLGPDVNLVAVGHGTVHSLLGGTALMDMLESVPEDAAIVSELTLKRRVGLIPPRTPEPRTMAAAEIARLSGLDEELLFWLALFDVVDPVDDGYGYRDLVAAREVARLLDQGCDLADVVRAAVALGRLGLGLSQAKLVRTAGGGIARSFDGRLAGLDGQYWLPLDDRPESIEEVLERALDDEAAEDYAAAERGYRRALHMDGADPVIPFNLGNVLAVQGQVAEAMIAWRLALERDPGFAEAWFHLAVVAEETGRFDEAAASYGRALKAWPGFADAAYRLALLLYLRGRFAEAVPAWDRFLALEPNSHDAELARRYACLCRLQSRRNAGSASRPADTVSDRPGAW